MWMRKDTAKSTRAPLPLPAATLGLAGMILGAAVSMASISQPAQADQYFTGNNAARVNGYMKPCFGMLLDAQLRTCGVQRHYRESGYLYGYYGRGRYDATIDCDRSPRGYVEEVVKHIRPGGVLFLKAHNRSCIASLDVQHSLTIVGQGYGAQQIPVLVAPDGQPCIRIAPTAEHVIIKDAYISSPRGEQSACIDSANAELTVQNSEIRYQGDASAINVAGGRFNLIETSHIVAKTRTSAINVRFATFFAENSEVATTSSGLTAVLSGDSQIQGVLFQQLADWRGFERGEESTGLDIKLDSADSILSMNDLKVQYFTSGVELHGAGEALLSHSYVTQSDHGITASLNRVRLLENTIIASEIGINIEHGTGYIGNNSIAKVRTAGILAGTDGQLRMVDNRVDPDAGGCPNLQWGNVEPSQRVCTPWYRGSVFDVPGDATDQYMFDQYWPRMNVASNATPPAPGPRPVNNGDPARP